MAEAVVIAESPDQDRSGRGTAASAASGMGSYCYFPAGVELLGESVIGRLFQGFGHAGVMGLSLIIDSNLAGSKLVSPKKVETYLTPDVWSAALHKLLNAKAKGVGAIVLAQAAAYVDFDPADAVQFHEASEEAVTRVWDDEHGPLDVWVVDPASFTEKDDLRFRLQEEKASYRIRSYVNRLQNLHDLRRLVVDGLTGRCGFRPHGSEVRPGLWMADGAQVKRGARIVAPAFIGRDVTISDQCLITRCSNIESNAHIDYGTVVEDSSVLSDTYVGIGLDLAHSIADGVILQNFNYDVTVEITDPVVMRSIRQNKVQGESNRQWLTDFRSVEAAIPATNETT